MNLLYDHNPSNFLSNIELFVTQINNVDYLNLFISNLKYYYFIFFFLSFIEKKM